MPQCSIIKNVLLFFKHVKIIFNMALAVVHHKSDYSDETHSETEECAATASAVSSKAIVGHVPREYSKPL